MDAVVGDPRIGDATIIRLGGGGVNRFSARLLGLNGLRGIGAAQQELLLRCLKDEHDLMRMDAICALAEAGDEKAMPGLVEVALNDPGRGKLAGGSLLRRRAHGALERIATRTGTVLPEAVRRDSDRQD